MCVDVDDHWNLFNVLWDIVDLVKEDSTELKQEY